MSEDPQQQAIDAAVRLRRTIKAPLKATAEISKLLSEHGAKQSPLGRPGGIGPLPEDQLKPFARACDTMALLWEAEQG